MSKETQRFRKVGLEGTYIELPSLDVLPGIFTCDDYNQLRDLASDHPFVQLRHDFLDIGFDLVVRRYEHCEAIFLDSVGGVSYAFERTKGNAYAVKSSAGYTPRWKLELG